MIISGTYNLIYDINYTKQPLEQLYLQCDTSLGPVTINLFQISQTNNYWNSKIFVSDQSNNAAINNITINAFAGDTINASSSVILNTNKATFVLYIANDTQWIGLDSNSFTGSAYNTVENQGTPLPQRNVINFTGAGVTASDTGSITEVNIPTQQAYNTIQDEGFPLPQRTTVNFVGDGVNVTDTGTETQVNITALTSVGLTMPSAFILANNPLTSNGSIIVTGAGTASQYIKGDGQLATFPTNVGGGSSVDYYLNGSVNQGVFAGDTYYELNRIPVIVPNTDFSISTNGYVSQFITDNNDPQLLYIPAGGWEFQLYFSADSAGNNPTFYIELYKYDGTIFTPVANNSAVPVSISNGTTITLYSCIVTVPYTPLAITDRIAIRVYVTNDTKTITLHTQGPHLSKVITTFSYGVTAINGLTDTIQYLSTGTAGTDFGITQLGGDTNVFNLPVASAINTGKLSNTDWSTFNSKQNALTLGDLTESTSSVLTFTGNIGAIIGAGTTIQVSQASSSTDGYLSSTDWNTFNNKQDGLSFGTAGSVQFSSGTGLNQNSSNFFWDNSTNRLGIGTNTPSANLSVDYGGTYTIPKNLLKISQSNSNEVIKILDSGYPSGSQIDSVYASWGFGTSADLPSGNRISVKGNTSGSGTASIIVQDSNSNYTFIVRDDGKVGIGTASPLQTLTLNGSFGITDGNDITLGTVNGTKIGTSISQKIGFFNATPIPKPGAVTDLQGLANALTNLGLITTSLGIETTINLTTTGSSGPASWTAATNTLNIPDYSTALSGYVPTSRTITINGTLQDLTVDRTWNVGTVTSVGLTLGTTGTDINIGAGTSPVTSSGTITLNIPDASATARGVITTSSQTIAGAKTFSIAPILTSLTANQILALDASKNIQTLTTATYPSLTELSYVKGVTSAIQTQINGKVSTGLATSSGLTMNTNRLLGRTTAGVGAIQEIELQTVGNSGAATLTGGILNIPDYSSGLTGYVPYTGASNSLQLGAQGLQVNTIYGTFTATGNLDLRSNSALSGYVRFPDGGTAGIWTGDLVGSPAWSAIYVNPSTGNPASDNYTIASNGGGLRINGYVGDPFQEAIGLYNFDNYANGGISISPSSTNFWYQPVTSNNPTSFIVNIPSNTGQTAGTNIPNFKIIGNTKQWAAGAITNQYWNHFTANTAAFALSPSTITNSYGLYVEAATVGTNATITNNYALGLKGQFLADFDGTGKTFQLKEFGSGWTYGWGIYTNLNLLRLPNTVYIETTDFFLQRSGTNGLIRPFNNITIQSQNGSKIYFFGDQATGNVGINTITPSEKLSVAGNAYVQDGILVGSTTTALTGVGIVFAQNGFRSNAINFLSAIYGYTNSLSLYSKFNNGIVDIGTTAGGNPVMTIAENTITIANAKDIVLNTTTGTKIGTATTQKLGFFNATPIPQPAAVTTVQGLSTALSDLGLIAVSSPSIWNVTPQSGATYIASNNDYVLVNASTQTITLPTPAPGRRVGVKVITSVTNIQVITNGSGITIDGVDRSSVGLGIYNQWDAYTFVSSSTAWYIES